MRFSIICFYFLLSSCATQKLISYSQDDLQSAHKFKGGRFVYEAGSAVSDNLEIAKKYCDDRKVFIKNVEQKSANYTSYVSAPQTSTFQASVSNDSSLNSAVNIEGQQTVNSVMPIQRTLTNNYVDFVCLDSDVNQKIYLLTYSTDNSRIPKCVDYTQSAYIGDNRIKALSEKDDSKNCIEKEGWFSHYDELLQKEIFVYLGKKGLSTCRNIENYLVDNEIKPDKIEYAARKFSKCK